MWQSSVKSHHELCTETKAEPEAASLHSDTEHGKKNIDGFLPKNTREDKKEKKEETIDTTTRGTMKDHTQRRGCEGKKIQEIVLPAYQMKIKKHLTVYF